ncbi:FAD-dependent oxidoreductase [Kribbella italica]|uniref:ferredoxin--NADP(+) reductase n=1 Tax=Kribbella italica TaxID=1540520 RepID=A0A7W9JGC5_9ACTN|nr:FAD-dependent oxidoreductase [Kribbella italica]MBB5841627.1 ferredoxin--NADP+ reductase [Kribbella italica]
MSAPLRVAVVGAGPAGIYAADILIQLVPDARVDLFEKLPAPYGLVRYGVSPDHPRIKKIIESLHVMLEAGRLRLLCNIDIGTDLTVDELRSAYDAVIIATGAITDVPLNIPGVELPGSFGAADFVSWYDGHPDVPTLWPLEAESVGVIGAGNVALDVSRMLIKHAHTLLETDISDNVHSSLAANPIRDLHLFARRGPADVRFSPTEMRELGQQHDVDIVVDPADLEADPHIERMTRQFAPTRHVVETMRGWAAIADSERTASRRVHLHFYQAPVAILGSDKVEGLRMERMTPDGYGHVTPSGTFVDHQVQAVYRAIGYASTPLPGVPFDHAARTVPHRDGAVTDENGNNIPGLFATGWIKRGPVGLIGSTKSDARQTIETLLDQIGRYTRQTEPVDIERIVDAHCQHHIDWDGWLRIDAAEQQLGADRGRHRIKIISRKELTTIGRTPASPDTARGSQRR